MTAYRRQLTTFALLVSFGLPAVLGFGLHAITGPHAGEGHSTVCCDCCQAHQATQDAAVHSDVDCAICEFLAVAKSADQTVSADTSFEALSAIRLARASSSDVVKISHPAAPRAPPV